MLVRTSSLPARGAIGLSLSLACLSGCPVDEPPSEDDATSEPATTDPPAAVCIPGQQLACPCVGGEAGVQACNADGSGFEPCQCEPPATDDTTGAASSGDTTDTGTTAAADASTSTGTTDAEDSTSTTDAPGLCDDYPGSVGTECDPWLQDCPAGEKCTPWADDGGSSWNATRCAPVEAFAGAPGDACTVAGSGTSGLDSCELGAVCWNVDPSTNEGTCVAQCTGCPDAPVCDEPGTSCAISNEGVVQLCRPSCDPLAQSCPDGDGCYPVGTIFACAADASGTGGAYGDACLYINGCDPGLVCLADTATPGCATAGCCTELCDVDAPLGDAQCSGEPQGQTCQAWYAAGAAPMGYEDVGVCALP